ncbi:MAG TPA: DUF2911 domain-containing protein [Chitinophagaceae bacterium]|nr:DUF2911 domain-containing protein [Chitinophagaceae bacterium]
MKRFFLAATALAFTAFAYAQGGNNKPPQSPPASASETIASGAVVTINYGQPSVRGREIGKDVEPMDGKVWRAGANKATTFEVSKDVQVEGKALPAGKYSFFTLSNGDDWTLIFNKTWDQWGAYDYKDADDALRVNVKGKAAPSFSEKLTYTISPEGTVSITWGSRQVTFTVK